MESSNNGESIPFQQRDYLILIPILFCYSRPNSPTKKDDTIEVHLNQDDVQVTLTDEHGNPLPLKDVDLQLKLPAKCKDTSFKGFQGVILPNFSSKENKIVENASLCTD